MTRIQINELRRMKRDIIWACVILPIWIIAMVLIAPFGEPVFDAVQWTINILVFAAAFCAAIGYLICDWEDYQDLKERYND